MRIILDTNFLISLVKFRIDIEEIKEIVGKCELLTLDLVVKELEKLASSKGEDSKNARVALQLIKSKNIKIIKAKHKNTDKALISLADKNTLIATNDKELRKTLRAKTIYLRSKKHLAIS